jgi:uncharacterized protein (DUF1919 family)
VNFRAGLSRRYDEVLARDDRRRLRNRGFTLIANDCWGGALYQRFRLPYTSPFVGLMVPAPDYVRLLADLPGALDSTLRFVDASRHAELEAGRQAQPPRGYPVGVLGGELEIHFVHYGSPRAAREAWCRRVERVDLDRLWIKFDGSKDGAAAAHREAFDRLHYEHKVMFVRTASEYASAVHVPKWCDDGAALLRRASPVFDVVDWLDGGPGTRSGLRRTGRGLVRSPATAC